MPDEPKVTPKKKRSAGEWRPVFLATLRNSGNVRAACEKAGIARKTAYDHKDRSPEFAAQWDEAIQEACDILEAAAFRRATASSDTLLIFLLKANRPAKYREVPPPAPPDLSSVIRLAEAITESARVIAKDEQDEVEP